MIITLRMYKTIKIANAYFIHHQNENTNSSLINTNLQEHLRRENFSFHLKAKEHKNVQMSFVFLFLKKCDNKHIF